MATFPFYNEPTHDEGVVTNASGNAARTTATSAAEQRLVVDAVDKIFLLEPNKHPLVTLLTNVGKVWDGKAWVGAGIAKASTTNPEFKWFEDYYGGRFASVAAGYNNSDNPVTITPSVVGAGASSAYIFTPGDVIRNARTGENMIVATIASATTITATRAFGTTAAATGLVGDSLFIIGNASEENAGARNVNTTRSTPNTNYTQIFRTSIALSNTEKEVKLYGGPDLPYQRAKKGTEHSLDIERAFWWGQKFSDTGGTQGHIRRATGGVLEFIQAGNSYVQNQNGPITAPDFNTFLREGFTYGNNEKMLFASGLVLQAINEMARGQIRIKPEEKTYGIQISEWFTPFGMINIVHNPLFIDAYASYAFLMDMECFRYRFLSNRDTTLRLNIQAPDIDGQVDEYLTEAGLERKQAPRHALLLGVTS